jgi:hypothetical protein
MIILARNMRSPFKRFRVFLITTMLALLADKLAANPPSSREETDEGKEAHGYISRPPGVSERQRCGCEHKTANISNLLAI